MHALNYYMTPNQVPGDEAVRLAMLLDIDEARSVDYLNLSETIASGLSINNVGSLTAFINEFQPKAIHKIVSESTLSRARKKKDRKLSRESSERFFELSRVIDQAALVFHGDDAKIRRFMTRPNPLLDSKTPFEVMASSNAGAETVILLLKEAQASVAI